MFNIYFSDNNEGNRHVSMECFETRKTIDSAIKFIVTLWPEEDMIQRIALITNAVTNTVIATVMRGPTGECIVTLPDLPNPTIRVYSVLYNHITCPMCHGEERECTLCYGKRTKLVCRVTEAHTIIHLPVQATEEHPIYTDDDS